MKWLELKLDTSPAGLEAATQLLEEQGIHPATDTVAVVTNDFHVARARLIAQKKGYEATIGVGAPIPWLHLEINYYLREAFAVVKSAVFD